MNAPVRRLDESPRVQRWDRVQLQADLVPSERTPQGYLRTHAAVAVPGVMEYTAADGSIVRELIPPEELHKTDSLITLASLPATLGHPDKDVDPDNVGELGVGNIGNEVEILEETGHVRVGLVLRRRDALEAIDDGALGVSPGYTCNIDPTPGEHPIYGKYDAVQRNRRYNHLAVGVDARGGPTVHLRADSADRAASQPIASPPSVAAVRKVQLGGTPRNPAARRADKGIAMLHLITIAALLGMTATTRQDGTPVVKRNDMELTEEQLAVAIREAIVKMKAEAAEAAEEPAEGEMTLDQAKEEISRLEGELATLSQAEDARKADAKAAAEKDARARMDSLAKRLGVDTASWTDTTTANDRALVIAKAQKLVAADVVVRSDAAPKGIEPATLGGMVEALRKIHMPEAAQEPRTDAYAALNLEQPKRARRDDDTPAPSSDPFADSLKRNRDARS